MKWVDERVFLAVFLKEKGADIARISRGTEGRMSKDDLISEAFLLVVDLGRKLGRALDLASPHDQDMVLARLYNQHVKFLPAGLRRSLSLEQTLDYDDGGECDALAERLAASEGSEPLYRLLGLEEAGVDPFVVVESSYSEASAYIILLERFSWSAVALAEHLKLSFRALLRRFVRAREAMWAQPSLFDGVERIDVGFQPWIRQRRLPVEPSASW